MGKGSSFAPENTPVTIDRFVPGMQRFALDWRQDVKQIAVEHHFAIWRRRLVTRLPVSAENSACKGHFISLLATFAGFLAAFQWAAGLGLHPHSIAVPGRDRTLDSLLSYKYSVHSRRITSRGQCLPD